MNLLDSIYVRKSVRKYNMELLDKETIKKLYNYIKTIPSLDLNVKTDFYITQSEEDSKSIKGMYKIDSPNYIFVYSDDSKYSNLEIGFKSQIISLYLTSIGIGSCHLGVAKPSKDFMKKGDLSFKMMISIGYPLKDLTRTHEQFNRLDINGISNDNSELIEVMRLAPSGMNFQPWYIHKENDNIYHIYNTKKRFTQMNCISIGMCLAHAFIYAKENRLDIKFIDLEKNKKDMDYIISFKMS